MGSAIRKLFPVLFPMLFLAGCMISTFDPVNGDGKFKGTTMAVIAGMDNQANIVTAQYMTVALQKHTRFKVLSQKQVASAIGKYPADIQGPWKSTYFEIEVDYSRSDQKKIRAMQKQLGVDYLYVLWTPSATVYNEKIHSLNIVGQMFENGKEVGNGQFNAVAGSTDCCLVPAPDTKEKKDAIKDTAEYVAKEIGEKTGKLKQ